MIDWIVAIAFAGAMLAAAYGCYRVAYTNWVEAARLAGLPPLDVADILAVPERGNLAPKGWPDPESLDDYRVAAAYRDLARDRRDSLLMWGELVLLFASAWLGLTVSTILDGLAALSSLPPALVGVAGLLARYRANDRWGYVARVYDRARVGAQPKENAASAPRVP